MSEQTTKVTTPTDILRERIVKGLSISQQNRVLIGLEHSDLSMKVVEDGIRHQNPDATDEEIHRLLKQRIDLMRFMENAP